jgi:hypothetical protein
MISASRGVHRASRFRSSSSAAESKSTRSTSSPPPEPSNSTQAAEPTGVPDRRDLGSATSVASGARSPRQPTGATGAWNPAESRSPATTANDRPSRAWRRPGQALRRSQARRPSVGTTKRSTSSGRTAKTLPQSSSFERICGACSVDSSISRQTTAERSPRWSTTTPSGRAGRRPASPAVDSGSHSSTDVGTCSVRAARTRAQTASTPSRA